MISVCIATYNGEKYIVPQLESILYQIGAEDEVVISDDGSTDRTREIIKSYGDSRIILIEGPCKGVFQNFSNAIAHASGDFIFLSDQDDIWHPSKIETIIPLLQTHMLVMHNASIIDSEGKEMQDQLYNDKIQFAFWKNILSHQTFGCCLALRKEVVPIVIPIPESKYLLHETWISALIQLHFGNKSCYYIDKKLIYYRRHGGNVSNFRISRRPISERFTERLALLYYVLKRYISNSFPNFYNHGSNTNKHKGCAHY